MAQNPASSRDSQPPLDVLLSLNEAAVRCGMSASHLRLLVRTGVVWGTKLGRNWVTTEAAVREYLARNLTADGTPSAAAISSSAQVAVTTAGQVDPITGRTADGPTVSLRATAPVDRPLLTLIGFPTSMFVTVSGSAVART